MYVLYINDDLVGPHFELIRKVCEPNSTSKPHVTIAGPIKKRAIFGLDFEQATVSQIELVEPGQFHSHTQNTVFILCDIQELKKFHYKPDYMTSPPHLTLYDGGSRELANKLIQLLQGYRWRVKIPLPRESRLSVIDMRAKRTHHAGEATGYSLRLMELFGAITGETLEHGYLTRISMRKRIELVDKIVAHMDREISRRNIKSVPVYNRLRIEQDHLLKTWEDIQRGYGSNQDELRLLRDSHEETLARNPREMRRGLGQFLTPPELAIEIMNCVREFMPADYPPIDFGDPSIGTGTFFSALRQAFREEQIASAIGVEIDKTVASITKRLWHKHGLRVIVNDFFLTRKLPKRNLIVSNPPYVRHHYLSKAQKKLLQGRVSKELGISISGLSSLYIYFMLLSHKWLEEGALSAWLVPSEFMETNYGATVRDYLTHRVSLLRIHRFDPKDTQFEGVVVASSVIIFRNETPNDSDVARLSFGGSISLPKRSIYLGVGELGRRVKWPTNPDAYSTGDKSSRQLRDLFIIQRGIATGANSFFILPRVEAKRRGIPEAYLRPILPSSRELSEVLIKSEKDGYPKLQNQLSVIDCPLPEEDIRKRHPRFWKYLQEADDLGVRDKYLVQKRNPWYKQEVREAPPFLCTYLGRDRSTGQPFRFFCNESNAIATNGYLLLYPRKRLKAALLQNASLKRKVFSQLQKISIEHLQDSGRVYGGGLYKLEPKELGSVSIDFMKDLTDLVEVEEQLGFYDPLCSPDISEHPSEEINK